MSSLPPQSNYPKNVGNLPNKLPVRSSAVQKIPTNPRPQYGKHLPFPEKPRKKMDSGLIVVIILIIAALGISLFFLTRASGPSRLKHPSHIRKQIVIGQPINTELSDATIKFDNLLYGGVPVGSEPITLLKNMAYYTGFSEKRKTPLWVGYRLDPHHGSNQLPRPGGFAPDNRIRANLRSKMYKNTGYDRGHMCPNAAIALRYGKKAQQETFLMSNVVPQKPELNRKVWERLERLEEDYSNRFDTVWVITGPIFDDHIEIMKKNIEIPDAFFKIILDEKDGRVRALPFIFPQDVTGKEPISQFVTSIDEIERQTGLNFLEPMTDEFEDKLESETPTLW